MANYIRLKDIERVAGDRLPDDLMSKAGQQSLSELLQDPIVVDALIASGYTAIDLAAYLNNLSAETLLFQRWIESNTALDQILTEGILSEYRDNQGIASHRLIEDFRRFVSPFLSQRLLTMSDMSSDKVLLEISSFLPLLDNDHRFVIEDRIFASIRKQLNHINDTLQEWNTEEILMAELMPLLSDEVIERINASSKASYANKLFYVDTILKAFYAPGCTPRFANWLIKRLELLDLNEEHQVRITQFKRELASGDIKVQNSNFIRSKSKTRLLPIAIVALLAGLVFWIIYFKPFNQKDVIEDKKNSSFTELTEAERREIDSLIQTMSPIIDPEGDETDPGFYSGNTSILSLRQSFKNDLMEQIYEDHSRDSRLLYLYPQDSCMKSGKFIAYKGTHSLNDNKKGVECVLRNESEYHLVLFVADNKKGGKVYTTDLKQWETLEFRLDKGQVITAVAGDSYTKFTSPIGATKDQLPSGAYTHHFCQRDQNFEESLNRSYVMSAGSGDAKFVIAGNRTQYIQFFDLTGVLDPY